MPAEDLPAGRDEVPPCGIMQVVQVVQVMQVVHDLHDLFYKKITPSDVTVIHPSENFEGAVGMKFPQVSCS